MPCPDDDAIVDLLAGRLAEPARVAVVAHLEDCAACRQLVADAGGGDPDDEDELDLGRGAQLGRYVISRALGAGAMGVVYAAHDPQLGREVAIKLLRPDALGDRTPAAARDAMLREAQTLARLSHPNVIPVHDTDVHGDRVFVVMELVDGVTLREWLAAAPRAWPELREVFLQIGRGLAAAHAAGIIHRDIKPDNVLVGRDGRVRVTDFGLARWESAGPRPTGVAIARAAQRNATTLAGTPAYMSPEQLAGERVDARSDVFALCMVLYEAIYGRRPFGARRIEPEGSSSPAAAPKLRVPARVKKALERGLAFERDDRWPTMTALVDELAARRGLPVVALGAGAVALGVAIVLVTRGGGRAASAQVAPARDPVAALDRDGRLELLVAGAGGQPWRIAEDAAGDWGAWERAPALSARALAASGAGRDDVALAAVDAAGALEVADGGAWQKWAEGDLAQVALARDPRRVLHAFAIRRAGGPAALVHYSRTAGGTAEDVWRSGGAEQVTAFNDGGPAGGRVRVFAILDHAAFDAWQQDDGGWSAWQELTGGPPLRQVAATVDAEGRLSVVALDASGRAYHREVREPGGDAVEIAAWTSWEPLGDSVELRAIAYARAAGDAHLEAFAVTAAGTLVHTWQTSERAWIGRWEPIALDPAMAPIDGLAVGVDRRGILHVFAATATGAMWLYWQASPASGPWHGWRSL